jgi:CheY-like chemotaxis protein
VVDDVEDSRELYVQYLSFLGYQVYGAANGLRGLELAALHHPVVVVLDLSMPGMDGWEVCGRLKREPSPPRVIVVTGHGLRGTPQTQRDLPCDAYFLKPCLPDDLESEIRRQLQPSAA